MASLLGAEALTYNPYGLPPEGITLDELLPQDIKDILHPVWLKYNALHPLFYYGLFLFWLFAGIFSVIGNGLVMYIFAKAPELRNPTNLLIINLAFSDFMIMACLVPEFLVNCAMGGIWQFGKLACDIHAFCGALFGYAQIVTLVFISYDRYTVIVKGFRAAPLTYGKVILILIFIWAYSLGWAITPFFGFGKYALDGILTECSFDYMSTDFMNVTFMWSVTASTFFLPLSIIILAYYYIAKAVFSHEKALRDQAKKMNVLSLRSNDSNVQSAEIRIAKVAMINVSLWVMAWTPFTVICLIGVSGDQSLITPLIGSLSVVFAKTSCVYNPLIYAISHPRYRQALKREVPWICIRTQDATNIKDQASNASEMVKVQDCGMKA